MEHNAPNRLREIRKAKGLTLEGLAALVGSSNQQIQRLEKGERRLSDEWMRTLGQALGVAPWAFFPEFEGDADIAKSDYNATILAEVTHDILTCALEEYVENLNALPDGVTDTITGAILSVYEDHAGIGLDMTIPSDRERLIDASRNVFRFAIKQKKTG